MKQKPLALIDTHPNLAKEAYGWDPAIISAGSGIELEWKCIEGHVWTARVYSRKYGTGCPFCSGRFPVVGLSDLATTHPELALQAHGWDPTTVSFGSGKKVEWKCQEGHTWKTTVVVKSRVGLGCPVCLNQKVLAGFNDLATSHPELALQAHGWDATKFLPGSGKTLEWKCNEGHVWTAKVSSRKNGANCPVCANQKVLAGFNDIATTHPELALQAHGWDPSTISVGSDKKFAWKCIEGHVWTARVYSRKYGTGCPFCSGRLPIMGLNDLSTTHPELAEQAHGWDPRTGSFGSDKKFEWKCQEGHIWKANVGSRARLKSGCPVCINQKVLAGFNDLATTHPDLSLQAHGWDPTKIIAGTHKKLEWKCQEGHTWKASVGSRSERGLGCPVCINQKVLMGFNDLATTHPEIAFQAHGWDPTRIIAGTNRKLEWKCQEGHIWKASGNDRKRTDCPSCSKTGFDPNAPAYLYFLHQIEWKIYQIGITNVPDTRLKKHKRNGFEVYEIRGPMDGYLTQEIEQSIIKFLRSKKVNLPSSNLQGKFDGYTESWTMESFQVNNLKELIDMASDAGF